MHLYEDLREWATRTSHSKDMDGRDEPCHDDANAEHYHSLVMPGLVPGIHVLTSRKDVDART